MCVNEDRKVFYCHKLLTKLNSILDTVSCQEEPLVQVEFEHDCVIEAGLRDVKTGQFLGKDADGFRDSIRLGLSEVKELIWILRKIILIGNGLQGDCQGSLVLLDETVTSVPKSAIYHPLSQAPEQTQSILDTVWETHQLVKNNYQLCLDLYHQNLALQSCSEAFFGGKYEI